jgi:hypothetical protein
MKRIGRVIDETAAVGVRIERPTERVQHLAGAMACGIDLPYLFETDPVVLRIGIATQAVARFQHLAEVASAALREDRVLPAQLIASLKSGLASPVARYAHVTRDDSRDALVVVEHFRRSKTGQYVAAERFGLLTEPTTDIAKTDYVIAAVVQSTWEQHRRQRRTPRFIAQPKESLGSNGRAQRCAALAPVREQLFQSTRLEHRAGHDMRADSGAFLHDADTEFAAGFPRELSIPASCGEAGRPGADDDDVEFHAFAGHDSEPTGGRRNSLHCNIASPAFPHTTDIPL